MNLALAQALTSASNETQRHVVNEVKQGFNWTPTEVARFIGKHHMKVEDAIFLLEAYKGEISQNLFQEESDALFLDSEQAKRLQHKAMQAKAEELRKEHVWVDTLRSSELMTAEYFSEGKGEPGAVLVFYEESGKVETHAPAYKRDEPEKKDKSKKESPRRGKGRPKPSPNPPKRPLRRSS